MSSQRVEPSTILRSFPDPTADHVSFQPTHEELRELAAPDETCTEYGSPSYVSEQRSRSADRTRNLVDDAFTDADWDAIDAALEHARERDLVCLDRRLGRHEDAAVRCRYVVPAEYARIALAWSKLVEPADGEPDLYTLQLPDWPERRIRVLPEAGVTLVLGSDYTGEAKKSFLRLFMYRAKQQGGLGLHAGSKRVTVANGEDEVHTVGQLFLGLSATGKSTLTGHGCWLDPPEGAALLQDDVCALLPDGTVAGSEGGGLYIKTLGLDASEQPALHRAATSPGAVLENVRVEPDGTVDFDDDTLTANSRAVVRREDLPSAASDIDLASVDQAFFITRNPLVPPVARLTSTQAAAAFVLGESVRTSAGDPDRAGEAVRVVGTNPFIVGSEGAEGNRFRRLVEANDVACFLMNTGHVGPDERPVEVEDSVRILTAVARGTVEWARDDLLGLDLPERVPGVDLEALYPPDRYADYGDRLAALRAERREHLAGFEALDPEIADAVY